MDPSSLDPSHGHKFSSEVRSSLGRSVCSPNPDLGSSFWLIAAFSSSRLRLSSESVSFILQSVLGGSADLFSVVELEQQLFKFTILDQQVGLRVYALKSFSCATFKVFFHLWNENGLARARLSSTSDSGPRFEWVPAKKQKSVSSCAAATSQGRSSPNRSIGKSKSVFSRLNFRSVPDLNLQPNHLPCSLPQRPNHGWSFLSRAAIDSNRPASNSNRVASDGPHFLSGANAVPLGNRPSKPKPTQRPSCSRCLSNFHTWPNCHSSTRCTACFQLGHVAFSCRFPPRFPGLSKDGVFSTQIRSVAWDPLFTATWFKYMTSGASASAPPVLTLVSSTSIPWFLPSSAFLSLAQSPSESPAESRQDVLPESRVTLELRPPTPPPAQQSPPPQSPHPHSEPSEPELQS
jgi:hypothetical protein